MKKLLIVLMVIAWLILGAVLTIVKVIFQYKVIETMFQ